MKLLLSLLLATSAFAQTDLTGSGGTISVIPKATNQFSGSLSLSVGNGPGYGGTFGGAIVPDKMWFFASAERVQPLVTNSVTKAFDVKSMAQIGDRQNLAASFVQSSPTAFTNISLPTNFLSLHYTSLISNNMVVSASISRER